MNKLLLIFFLSFELVTAQKIKISRDQVERDNKFGNKYRIKADTYLEELALQIPESDSSIIVINQTIFPPYKIKSISSLNFIDGKEKKIKKFENSEKLVSKSGFENITNQMNISSFSTIKGNINKSKKNGTFSRFNTFNLISGDLINSNLLVTSVGGSAKLERREAALFNYSVVKVHPISEVMTYLTNKNTVVCRDIYSNDILLEKFIPLNTKELNYYFSNSGNSLIINIPFANKESKNYKEDSLVLSNSIFNDDFLSKNDRILGFTEFFCDGTERKIAYVFDQKFHNELPDKQLNYPQNIISSNDDKLRVIIYSNGLIAVFEQNSGNYILKKFSKSVLAPQLWISRLKPTDVVNNYGAISNDNTHLIAPGVLKEIYNNWKNENANSGKILNYVTSLITHGDLGQPTFLDSNDMLSIIELNLLKGIGSFFDSYTDFELENNMNIAYASQGKDRAKAKNNMRSFIPNGWFFTKDNNNLVTSDRRYDFKNMLEKIKNQ